MLSPVTFGLLAATHTKEEEVLAVNANDIAAPEQTAEVLELVIVGSGLTVTSLVAVFVQPLTSVPVTVYVSVPAGTNEVPLVAPPVQVYDTAPVPVKVTDAPAHTVADTGVDVELTVGNGFTVTFTVCELPTQPPAVAVGTTV